MIISLNEIKALYNLEDHPVTITGDGSYAIINYPNHNKKDGDFLTVSETNSYNGTHVVTRLNPNQLKFKSSSTTTEQAILNDHDYVLNKIIKASEDHILQICSIKYGATGNVVETKSVKDEYVRLDSGPIDSVLSVKLSDKRDYNNPTNFIELTEYDYLVLDDRILLLNNYSKYLNLSNSIQITYTCKECPDAVKQAILQLIEFNWRIYNDQSIALVSETENGNTINYQKEVPKHIYDLITNYRRYF